MSGGYDYDYEYDDARVPEPGTRKKSGMTRVGSLLSGLFAIILFTAIAAAGGFFYIESAFDREGPLASETTVVVKRGDGARAIASALKKVEAISDSRLFLAGLYVNRANSRLRAGEYLIEANASMRQIMNKLIAGKSIQYKVTIPEGLTTLQALQRLRDHEVLVGDLDNDIAEGSLLPDTYTFTRGTSRQEVVQWMQKAQEKLIGELWKERDPDLPLSTPEEAIILASIVEKETGLKAERARVAGVFVNRLKQNMRLQSDPTIVYGIVGGRGTLGRPIRRSDINEKTAYNTYQIDGLPPTPIANPGRAAIAAVLNPAKTRDLFFVADGTGGHAFAETLAEHNRNVRRWRQIEKERKDPEATVDVAPPSEILPEEEETAALEQDQDATADQDTDATGDQDADDAGQDQQATSDPGDDATSDDAAAPADADTQTDANQRPAPIPAPGQAEQEISAIAKAVIEKAPRPKPKPPAPRRATRTQPDPDQPQVTVEPLPDTPNPPAQDPGDLPEPEPDQPAANSPSPSDLR